MTFQEMTDRVNRTNREKGHRTDSDTPDFLGVALRLALLHTEPSEAMQLLKRYGLRDPGKPALTSLIRHDFGLELADVIIRTIDLADLMGIDLEEALKEKMLENEGRPYQYGTPTEFGNEK